MRILILLFVFAQIHQLIEASNQIWSQATPWYFSEDQGAKNNFTDEIVRLVDDLRSDHFSVVDLGNRWWQHQQFGTFWKSRCKGWYYHLDQGWIYVDEWKDNGTWMYMPMGDLSGNEATMGSIISERIALGWMWSKSEHYPQLYNNELKDWMYFNKDRNESKYYCYSLKKYLTKDFISKFSVAENDWKSLEFVFFGDDYQDDDYSPPYDSELTYAGTFHVTLPKEEVELDGNWSSIIKSILEVANEAEKRGIIDIQDAGDFYKFKFGPTSTAVTSAILSSEILAEPKDDEFNVANISGNGYYTELVKLLIKYGAIGDKGSDLAAAALNGLSTTSSSFSSLSSSTSDYLDLLSSLTGDSGIGDADGDNNDFLNPQTNTVLDVSMDNVSLASAANITVGKLGEDTSFDVSSILNKAANHDDRKILTVSAAKDFTITGDLTIHNDNKVEDHALVLAAADDFYLRSEYSSENSEDYTNPESINIEYTGSNLAIASQDTMVLVNANITTGVNLAIGTLDELHIGLSDNHHSIITLSKGGNTPSPDNLYLYANDLISVNGLDIEGYVSKVYMEAHTLALRDVMFPDSSRVMLRSDIGELNFNPTPTAGHVNFHNTGHESIRGGADLVRSDFEGSIGHYNSVEKHPNGEPYISVRAQQVD